MHWRVEYLCKAEAYDFRLIVCVTEIILGCCNSIEKMQKVRLGSIQVELLLLVLVTTFTRRELSRHPWH